MENRKVAIARIERKKGAMHTLWGVLQTASQVLVPAFQ